MSRRKGLHREKGIVDVTNNEGEYDKVKDTSCEATSRSRVICYL